MRRKPLVLYINKHGLSHSFIATSIGGLFLILSGFITDPNLGRATTGILIASRGILSEISRNILMKKGYHEATSALPGMSIAAIMNWPACFAAKTIFEAIAYGLPAIAMSLKFLQYLPTALNEILKTNIAFQKAATFIHYLNRQYLNTINKYAGFNIVLSAPFFLIDVWIRQDFLASIAGIFLIFGGLLLATKTWFEITNINKNFVE